MAKIRHLRKGQLVAVSWRDIVSARRATRTALAVTVGRVYRVRRNEVVIATSWYADKRFAGPKHMETTAITRGAIECVVRLQQKGRGA